MSSPPSRPTHAISPRAYDFAHMAVPLVEDSPRYKAALDLFERAWNGTDPAAAEIAWLDCIAAAQASRSVYGDEEDE